MTRSRDEPRSLDEPCYTRRDIRALLPLLRPREQQILRARCGLLASGREWTLKELVAAFGQVEPVEVTPTVKVSADELA